MSYSYAVEQAIRASAILHKDQVRKGPVPYPYATHLFSVALIVGDYTNDENTIVAALLHNVLDDTDYTAKELEDDFGGPVKELVVSISEPPLVGEGKEAEELQKKVYLKQLREASERALIIVAGDNIHNMRTVVEEYYEDHSGFISEFGGSQDERLIHYTEISNILNRRLKNAILSEFNSIFTEYKNFLEDVREKQENY